MCLVFLAWKMHSCYDLVMVSNRDEQYARPSLPAHIWERQGIVGGKDKVAQGTWCAVNAQRECALVTNYRSSVPKGSFFPQSRGQLPLQFLQRPAGQTVKDFLYGRARESSEYRGYSLLVADKEHLGYYSNRMPVPYLLGAGIYGLSNAFLNTPWFKVSSGMKEFAALLKALPEVSSSAFSQGASPLFQPFMSMMEKQAPAPADAMPDTGLPYAKEKAYSARFVVSEGYGTRATTWVARKSTLEQALYFAEKTHGESEAKIELFSV